MTSGGMLGPWSGYSDAARAACLKGDYETAESVLKQAFREALSKQMLDQSLVDTSNELAAYYCTRRRYGSAASLYREIVKLRQSVLGEDHPDLRGDLDKLAVALRESGDKREAAEIAYRAKSLTATSSSPAESVHY